MEDHGSSVALPNGRDAKPSVEAEVHTWRIWVRGYGSFIFIGTATEAEDRREAKARHEGGRGMMWRLTDPRPSDALTATIVDRWEAGEGVPMAMLQDRAEAIKTEARAAIAKATSPADTASPSAATDRTS